MSIGCSVDPNHAGDAPGGEADLMLKLEGEQNNDIKLLKHKEDGDREWLPPTNQKGIQHVKGGKPGFIISCCSQYVGTFLCFGK